MTIIKIFADLGVGLSILAIGGMLVYIAEGYGYIRGLHKEMSKKNEILNASNKTLNDLLERQIKEAERIQKKDKNILRNL
jgi:hypothetical protein